MTVTTDAKTPDSKVTTGQTPPEKVNTTASTSTASGRKITTGAEKDEDIGPNASPEDAPVGTVQDALKSEIPTKEVKEDASEKEQGEEIAPITSLAQLREYHIKNGTAATQEQIDEVKELEAKILEEGGKKQRVNKDA